MLDQLVQALHRICRSRSETGTFAAIVWSHHATLLHDKINNGCKGYYSPMALKIDFWQPDLYLVLRMFFMLISAQIFYSKALKHHTQLMIVHG